MALGFDYTIAGSLIIMALIPLYIYRKVIFKAQISTSDLSGFLRDVRLFLQQTYPKVPFNYAIVDRVQNEQDSHVQQTLIIEDLVSQFVRHEYILHTQKPVHKDILWATYKQDSTPIKGKTPRDLARRKEAAWRRDNKRCDRCGTEIKLADSHLMLVKRIENGGTYHFENLMTLCSDCYRILNSRDAKAAIHDLHIQDQLLRKAHF